MSDVSEIVTQDGLTLQDLEDIQYLEEIIEEDLSSENHQNKENIVQEKDFIFEKNSGLVQKNSEENHKEISFINTIPSDMEHKDTDIFVVYKEELFKGKDFFQLESSIRNLPLIFTIINYKKLFQFNLKKIKNILKYLIIIYLFLLFVAFILFHFEIINILNINMLISNY